MAKNAQLKKEFLEALEDNLYVKPANKKYLIENFDNLPERTLKGLLKELKDQNDITEKYIKIAIDNDTELVKDMQALKKKMKKDVVELEESEEKGGLEEILEEELNKIK